MPLWDKSGTKPVHLNTLEKRDVIATNQGWTRRYTYTDTHSLARQKDEVLVAIGHLANTANMGAPSVSGVYITQAGAETGFVNTATLEVNVVFDEPLNVIGVSSIVVANTTDAGNSVIAWANATQTPINANNTIIYHAEVDHPDTYKIEAQDIGNTTNWAVSLNTDGEQADVLVAPAPSNAYGTFVVAAG